MWKLPPLKALRAFEAAARHMSFNEASRELNVTPSAISRQIKLIEDYFGTPLFERGHREVTLTPESARFVKVISGVFELIEESSRQLHQNGRNMSMTVSLPPTLLGWLLPRMANRPGDQTDFTVNFSTAAYLGGHVTHSVFDDVSIQARRNSEWPDDVEVDFLFKSYLTPVCTRQLAETMLSDGDLRQLRKVALLRSKFRMSAWSTWFEAMGERTSNAYRYQEFPNSSLAFQGAACGLGVAIGDPALLGEELRNGTLVMPFNRIVDSSVSYFAVYSRESLDRPQVRGFRRWLLKECLPMREMRSIGEPIQPVVPEGPKLRPVAM